MPKEVTHPYALNALDVTLKCIIKTSWAPQCNSVSHTTRKAGNREAKILPDCQQPRPHLRVHFSFPQLLPFPITFCSRELQPFSPHTSAAPLNICPPPVTPWSPSAALGRSCSCHNLTSTAARGTIQTLPLDWDPLLFSMLLSMVGLETSWFHQVATTEGLEKHPKNHPKA